MKIIHLTTFLDFGGIERKKENLSGWRDDNEWIFVAINKGGAASNKIAANGKQVLSLQLPYKIPNFKTILALYRLFKKEKPDIVHNAGAEANFHGAIAARLAGVPNVICEEIGIPNHSKLAKYAFRLIYRNVNYVVGESEIVVQNLRNNYNIPEHKLKKIYNFIKPDVTQESAPQEGTDRKAIRVISVARLVAVKNIELSLRVIARLIKEGTPVYFDILGDGPLMDKLSALCKVLDIEPFVKFHGYIEQPKEYMYQSDIFLLTSNHEGFSNALLEAMYCKLPCISTRVGGAIDCIQEGVSGFLVNTGDEDDLYIKLRNLIAMNGADRKLIGENAHQRVTQMFSLPGHIHELYKIYKK